MAAMKPDERCKTVTVNADEAASGKAGKPSDATRDTHRATRPARHNHFTELRLLIRSSQL
jgi:hypothetical protein